MAERQMGAGFSPLAALQKEIQTRASLLVPTGRKKPPFLNYRVASTSTNFFDEKYIENLVQRATLVH